MKNVRIDGIRNKQTNEQINRYEIGSLEIKKKLRSWERMLSVNQSLNTATRDNRRLTMDNRRTTIGGFLHLITYITPG